MGDVAALEGDLPRCRLQQARQQSGGRALAAPRLADDGERLPAPDREVQPVHRLNGPHLPTQESSTDRKVLDQPFDNDQVRVLLGARFRRPLRGRGHSFGTISCSQISSRSVWDRWQATVWPGSTGASSGRTSSLRPSFRVAYSQRGWNGQPGGTLIRLGGVPWIASSRS